MTYVDTGAMYRAIALHNIRRGTDIHDASAVEASLDKLEMIINAGSGSQRLMLNGEDVTDALRAQPIAEGSSVVAAYPAVREKLTALQQQMAKRGRVVMDGRDIGSHVLPWAQVKIYLDASLDVRTDRRVSELLEKGLPCDRQQVRREMSVRDERDRNRRHAPLIRMENTEYIDASVMTPDQVLDIITGLVNESAAK
jgi:cytidylate kinase